MLKVNHVYKEYFIENKSIKALEDINFKIGNKGSIALVGPSGSGKSTLAKIIAGLEKPTKGTVVYNGKKIKEPNKEIMLVFQNPTLLPWKTVLENVELAVLDKPKEEREEIALKYIDLVGLDGFEDSYPINLSGGMKPRVELARALCREPDILIMDEPFSSLDPLTANNLRNEIYKLYKSKEKIFDVLILITHNIEEAVFMGDRVLVLSERPGKIKADIKIRLKKEKRNIKDDDFYKYVDKITTLITQ